MKLKDISPDTLTIAVILLGIAVTIGSVSSTIDRHELRQQVTELQCKVDSLNEIVSEFNQYE